MTLSASSEINDSGYMGQIKSLGGILGGRGRGLTILNRQYSVGNVIEPIAYQNPRRVWMMVSCLDDGGVAVPVKIKLGSAGSTNVYTKLAAGGVLQIDALTPYIGELYCVSDAALSMVNVTEAELA